MFGRALAGEASGLDPWIAASINPPLFWTLVLLAPLLLGYLLARRYRSPGAQVSFILAGPAAWIIGTLIYDPDPGCDYDCVGRLVYGIALTFGVGAWWAGLLVAAIVASAPAHRRSAILIAAATIVAVIIVWLVGAVN